MSRKVALTFADSLVKTGITYGSTLKIEIFEEMFELKRETPQFNFLLSNVRNALFDYGFYLSGEGIAETGHYEILTAQENQWVGKLEIAKSERGLEGKQRLLINTKLDDLTDSQKRRHEAALRELSFKLQAMRREEELREAFGTDKRKMKKSEVQEAVISEISNE